MSVLNKQPFIKTLLSELTDEQLGTFASLINGLGNRTPVLRTLSIKPSGSRTNITNSDKGVKLCNLEINYSLYDGYLVFTNSHCVLISYTDSQKLMMFEISADKHNFSTIDEELSVLELRSELFDSDKSSRVVANPTLSGSESSLSGIEIDGTKYKVMTSSDVENIINGAINDTY